MEKQIQPPVRPISHEQQLALQNEMLKAENQNLKMQLQSLFNGRAQSSKLVMGEVMDGIAFSLQAAEQTQDEALAATAKSDLENLRLLLDKVVNGDFSLPNAGRSRIVVPR